jgi:hypothetical protein
MWCIFIFWLFQTHKCKNTQVSLLWVIHENFHPHNRSCFLHVSSYYTDTCSDNLDLNLDLYHYRYQQILRYQKGRGGTIPPTLLKNQEGLYSLDFGWAMAIKVSISVELWLLKSRFWPLGHKTILYCKVAYPLTNPGNLLGLEGSYHPCLSSYECAYIWVFVILWHKLKRF